MIYLNAIISRSLCHSQFPCVKVLVDVKKWREFNFEGVVPR